MNTRDLPDKKELGRKLRDARKDAGYTQNDVADIFGMSTPAVHRLEKGQMQLMIVVFLVLFFALLTKEGSFKKAADKVKRMYPLTGKRIKRKRERMQLTQAELAAELGTSRATIIRWEKGIFDSILFSYKWLALELNELERRLSEEKKAA